MAARTSTAFTEALCRELEITVGWIPDERRERPWRRRAPATTTTVVVVESWHLELDEHLSGGVREGKQGNEVEEEGGGGVVLEDRRERYDIEGQLPRGIRLPLLQQRGCRQGEVVVVQLPPRLISTESDPPIRKACEASHR